MGVYQAWPTWRTVVGVRTVSDGLTPGWSGRLRDCGQPAPLGAGVSAYQPRRRTITLVAVVE
jgi:hypothetical protein